MKDSDYLVPYHYDTVMEAMKWMEEIPFIQFPAEWEIKITPPFAGAVIRFRVNHPGVFQDVSVYLDCYERLGIYGEPYWEVYPYRDGVGRCAMKDTKRLLEMIADRTVK